MSQLELRLIRTVAASPASVWSFVADGFFANHRKWDPAIRELSPLSAGAVGEGTRGLEVRKFGGRQEAEFVVTEFRRPERFAFRNTSGPFDLERSYEFRPADRGTEFAFRFAMAPKGGMRLLFPFLKPVIARQVRDNIDRLRDLLEREAEVRRG